MQVKTITTAAGVNEIDFGNDGSQSTAHFYWLKNLGDSTLYVSANPNPIAEKDDVAELPAKGAVSVETDEGKIYILGAGKVEIHRTNSKFCPFDWQSSGSGGGETIDAYTKTESDAKYAQKTDIPTSLPANGGNADTVGGKSPSDFLPFQAYAPIYTGDIKDISNMGTYSCYKGDCTNLPDIDMWAYVIMIKFRDAGYKTFLCIEINPNPTTQHCRNIYIAREYDVDSSENMIWYKACDGGNAASADTLTDWGTRTVTNANDAPFGFCAAFDCENAPNTFWSTILTTGSSGATNYKTQIAFPWAFGAGENRIRYRCENDGKWGSWQEIYTSYNKPYVTGTFTVNASDTEQTISVPLTFNPSVVLLFTRQITLTVPKQIILIALSGTEYKIKIGVPNSGDLSALSTGFEAIINSWKGTASTIDYIAYK